MEIIYGLVSVIFLIRCQRVSIWQKKHTHAKVPKNLYVSFVYSIGLHLTTVPAH